VRMSEDFLMSSPVRLPLPFPAPNPLSSIINKSCVLNLMPLRNNAKWLDYSVYRNHGTIHGATWTTGKFGSALSFDGVDDYVEVPDDDSLDITDEITIEAWVKTNDVSGYKTIYARKYSNSRGQYWFEVDRPAQGYILFRILNGDGNTLTEVKTNSAVFSSETWTHVIAIYDSSYARIYVNGDEVKSVNTGNLNVPSASGPSTVGAQWYLEYTNFFNGTIDEVRIYNRALSAEEIKRLFEWSKSRH